MRLKVCNASAAHLSEWPTTHRPTLLASPTHTHTIPPIRCHTHTHLFAYSSLYIIYLLFVFSRAAATFFTSFIACVREWKIKYIKIYNGTAQTRRRHHWPRWRRRTNAQKMNKKQERCPNAKTRASKRASNVLCPGSGYIGALIATIEVGRVLQRQGVGGGSSRPAAPAAPAATATAAVAIKNPRTDAGPGPTVRMCDVGKCWATTTRTTKALQQQQWQQRSGREKIN